MRAVLCGASVCACALSAVGVLVLVCAEYSRCCAVSVCMRDETTNDDDTLFDIKQIEIALRPENTFLFTDRRSRGLQKRLGLGRNGGYRPGTHNERGFLGRWATEVAGFRTRKSRTNELCRSRFVKMADLCELCVKSFSLLQRPSNVRWSPSSSSLRSVRVADSLCVDFGSLCVLQAV